MTTGSGSVAGSAAPSTGGVSGQSKGKDGYWSLEKCKRAYIDYLGNKINEIEEQKDARRYYHGSQWTEEQLKVLKKRRQPPSTKNRIARKIDGTIGLIERLRQDPKAFPRTPKQEEGAELATAVLRYVLDEQEWKAKSPECARDGAVDGIGGIEIEIEQGDHGDPEVGFDIVEPDSFFYDPRSYRADFSDARYMGMGKWTDVEIVKDMFPDVADAIGGQDGSDLTSNPDREQKWFSSDGSKKLVRVVDIWYQHKGGWCWAIFTGGQILMEGKSYLTDEKNRETCKYIMFSCNVDHDGDRYGFVRNMKSSQDSFNFKHSKLNHILATDEVQDQVHIRGQQCGVERAADDVGAAAHHGLQRARAAGEVDDGHVESFGLEVAQLLGNGQGQVIKQVLTAHGDGELGLFKHLRTRQMGQGGCGHAAHDEVTAIECHAGLRMNRGQTRSLDPEAFDCYAFQIKRTPRIPDSVDTGIE